MELLGFVFGVCVVCLKIGVISRFILQSSISGMVSISWFIMFGGVMMVVMMKVLMIMQGWICFNLVSGIRFMCISMIMIIGILKVMLKVMNMVSMKLMQLLMFGVIEIDLGVKLLMNGKIMLKMKKQQNVIFVMNSSEDEIISGVIRCFLCVYRLGVMKVYNWYSIQGSEISMVISMVILMGIRKGVIMLVVIILLLVGSVWIIGVVSMLKIWVVNGIRQRNIISIIVVVLMIWLCNLIRCEMKVFLVWVFFLVMDLEYFDEVRCVVLNQKKFVDLFILIGW